jgi:hypothetical protein
MKTLFTIIICFFSFISIAQIPMTIKVNGFMQEISINDTKITRTTNIEKVVEVLGQPDRKVSKGKLRLYYIYDQLGLSFEVNNTELKTIAGMQINFLEEESEKAAKGAYQGMLVVDEFSVKGTTPTEEFKLRTSFKKMTCMANFCTTDPTEPGMACMLTIVKNNPTPLGQIVFAFKQ